MEPSEGISTRNGQGGKIGGEQNYEVIRAPGVQAEPERTPPSMLKVYVLADSGGAVGAFLTNAEAAAVKKRYPSVPLLIYAFPLSRDTPTDKIYILPYRQTNAVAYASNSRAECEKMQKTLLTVGLTYEDSIDYWECAVGRLIESGEKRLDELLELERLAFDGSACAELRKVSDEKTKQLFALHDAAVEAALAAIGHGQPTPAMTAENGKLPGTFMDESAASILDFVVPEPLGPESSPSE